MQNFSLNSAWRSMKMEKRIAPGQLLKKLLNWIQIFLGAGTTLVFCAMPPVKPTSRSKAFREPNLSTQPHRKSLSLVQPSWHDLVGQMKPGLPLDGRWKSNLPTLKLRIYCNLSLNDAPCG